MRFLTTITSFQTTAMNHLTNTTSLLTTHHDTNDNLPWDSWQPRKSLWHRPWTFWQSPHVSWQPTMILLTTHHEVPKYHHKVLDNIHESSKSHHTHSDNQPWFSVSSWELLWALGQSMMSLMKTPLEPLGQPKEIASWKPGESVYFVCCGCHVW